MTLLRALVSRFSALLGDVYYEGTVPPDAPYPYTVVSAKSPRRSAARAKSPSAAMSAAGTATRESPRKWCG